MPWNGGGGNEGTTYQQPHSIMPTLQGWRIEGRKPDSGNYIIVVTRPNTISPDPGTNGSGSITVRMVDGIWHITAGYKESGLSLASQDHWDTGIRVNSFTGNQDLVFVCLVDGGPSSHTETVTLSGSGTGGPGRRKPMPEPAPGYIGSVRLRTPFDPRKRLGHVIWPALPTVKGYRPKSK